MRYWVDLMRINLLYVQWLRPGIEYPSSAYRAETPIADARHILCTLKARVDFTYVVATAVGVPRCTCLWHYLEVFD